MPNTKRSGTLYVKVDGQVIEAIGNFTYNLGSPKREMLVGSDGVHGFKEMPQVPYIEGEARDSNDFDLESFTNITDATVTLELATGTTVVLNNAAYTADGDAQTEDGNIQLRFEGLNAKRI